MYIRYVYEMYFESYIWNVSNLVSHFESFQAPTFPRTYHPKNATTATTFVAAVAVSNLLMELVILLMMLTIMADDAHDFG